MDGRPKTVPEYRRVADGLRQKIRSGQVPVDGLLPSIPQIEAEFKVSANVARRALTELRFEGLIEIHHGIGSKVVATPGTQAGQPSEHDKIMQVISAMQDQIDRLAEQVARLEQDREQLREHPDSPTGRPSP